jgi:peptidoglycan hydrolase CwlO-like protein
MSPVNSAPSSSVDNEATAELPVLDVAAYESTLGEAVAHTDSWTVPGGILKAITPAPFEATMEMPAIPVEAIPTLTAATPAYDIDHSGTHEMPATPSSKLRRRSSKNTSAKVEAPAAAPAAPIAPQITVPPSPPLIEEWRAALARAERRIAELEERARIAEAERAVALDRANAECTQLRGQLASQVETLATARQRLGVQATDETELQDAYFARGDRITALEAKLAEQGEVLDRTRAQLHVAQQRIETLEADGVNLRATVARRNAQISILEADLLARQQRETALKARLDEALASIDPNVPELRAEIARNDLKVRELQAEIRQLRTHIEEKDADLQVAEESIRDLEKDLRDKNGKLEEASVTVEEWRAVIAESQRSILLRDNRIQQLEADLKERLAQVASSTDQTGEEIALEGPARLLIRTDGNTDFVHVLGRRTRIGRGNDNELVLDTKHVSRYHAVLLAGPVNTTIEDLNSTNGVYVNGKRITRQVLKDGDRVTVGKTQFRYCVRD